MANSITRFKKNKMRTLKLRLDKNLEQPKNKQSDRGCHEKKCTFFYLERVYMLCGLFVRVDCRQFWCFINIRGNFPE